MSKKLVLREKAALADWDAFRRQVSNSTSIDLTESVEARKERMRKLEANHEEWFKYYFPNFYTAEPADFHKKATKRIMENPEWYEVRAWARELAKSARSMMEDLKLLLTKKKRYKILVSSSYDAACKLLMPYKINLESNNRIINDYGVQVRPGAWTDGDFTTRSGFSCRAVGAGQSPRGTRKDEMRPDIIEFDDIDTDEDCRNEDTITNKWKWITEAVIPTRSVSKPTLIRWNGNIIAEDCCVVRACEFADKVDIINIVDENDQSTWPQKNTPEMIARIRRITPFSSWEKEYKNNPHTDGKIFTEMKWGPCPPLKDMRCVVVYADPATSNKDLSAVKSSKKKPKNSCKSVVVVGKLGVNYYIYTCWVGVVKNSTFIDWLYASRKYIAGKTAAYNYIENNSLQDPFYGQVLLPLIHQKGMEAGSVLPVSGDSRDKPEKFTRIEATLEPLNTQGFLILNEKERGNPYMALLVEQFKSVSPQSRTMDGPDAVEGAVFLLNTKESEQVFEDGITIIKRSLNKSKKY